MAGRTLWQLISNLSLNHLSLTSDAKALDALKELLQLYSFGARETVQQQINGIRRMECTRTTRLIGADAWRGFCQGTEVTLTFDRSVYVASSAVILASVLRHFLALHASVNSFVQVIAKQSTQEGEWKRWAPLAGEQEVL
jgi:type VI secretion system protein ImpG